MSDQGEDAAPDGEHIDGPQRLHPLTVPYRLGSQGISVAVAVLIFGLPSLTGLFASGRSLLALGAAGAVVAAVAAIVGYAVAYYRRFEYELTTDTFDIRSGVFSRREREIPLRRIQNVDISQNFVQRIVGLAEIRLETAGGSDTEAHLKYVGDDRAKLIQREVSRLSRVGESEETDEARFETVFEMTDRELGVLAIVSTDFRILSFVFLGASLLAPSAASAFEDGTFFGPETVVRAILGPVAGIATVIAIGLLAGVVYATRYYGFRLHRAPDELRYERGLLQQYSGTIPLGKVQSLSIQENVLARKLGYASLNIETAGQSGGEGAESATQSAIPLAERHRVLSLSQSIEPYGDPEFERPPARARLRYAARYSIAVLALPALLYVGQLLVTFPLYWYVPLVGLLLAPVAAHLKWKHRGYAVGEDYVVTRNGFWVRQIKVVPYHRVQTVFSTETVFQRRRDLGTVTIDTAGSQSLGGGDAKAVDVATDTVESLREHVAAQLYVSLRRRRAAGRADDSPTVDSGPSAD